MFGCFDSHLEHFIYLVQLSFSIKPKQLEAFVNILNGFDTLCIFPTYYGKILFYQLLPSVCLELCVHLRSMCFLKFRA